jgi:hypothetical protein
MEPEEEHPDRVRGWFVVEVGRRQAWPFLNLADPVSGRELRLYIDSTFSVAPGYDAVRQDDVRVFVALDALDGQTVLTAAATFGRLDMDFGAFHLRVNGGGERTDLAFAVVVWPAGVVTPQEQARSAAGSGCSLALGWS